MSNDKVYVQCKGSVLIVLSRLPEERMTRSDYVQCKGSVLIVLSRLPEERMTRSDLMIRTET
jgi:hypothetical protein